MRPLPPKEAIVPHHCWHFLGYSTAIPVQLVNSSRMVSALEIKLYWFFFFLCPVSLLIRKKKYAFCWKAHLLSQQEANSQAIWWISHTTSYVDIRDFWVQKQTPQKSKDFWLKMGAIRWSIFLERPLNASVTQNTSSWMIHQMEVLRSYRIPFWNFSSLPSPCLGMTNISLSWWNPGQPDWYTAPVSQQGLWTEPNCLNSFLSLRS